MSEETGGRRLARRRPKAQSPRRHKVVVEFSDEEIAVVKRAAASQGMAVATFLAVQGLAENPTGTETDAAGVKVTAVRELSRVHRQLRGVSTNVNQMAAKANSDGQLPPDLGEVLELVREVAAAVNVAVRKVSEG